MNPHDTRFQEICHDWRVGFQTAAVLAAIFAAVVVFAGPAVLAASGPVMNYFCR